MPDWEDTYDEEDDEMNTEATPDALADTIEMKVDIGPYITQQVTQRVINGVVLHYHKAVDEAVKASIHTLVKQLAADRFTEIARQRLDDGRGQPARRDHDCAAGREGCPGQGCRQGRRRDRADAA